jgi:hypothetical protein
VKQVKTKFSAIDLSWLPPAEEWDFRSVTANECRIASHWEYERQVSRILSASKAGEIHQYFPPNYRPAAREFFPQAWTTLSKEQRQKVVESFFAAPVVQVRKLSEFLKRMPKKDANLEVPKAFLEYSYVVIPHFSLYGVEAVIKGLEKWARSEAKHYRQSRRAQAAELPFDALKWLAVLRLDQARNKAHVTIERARETTNAYRRANPRPDSNGVFPTYASDGAWSKARNDAQRCQVRSRNDPSYLLAELAW